MLVIGIVAVLVAIYVILPKEPSHEYNEFCRIEDTASRYHSNRKYYIMYK